MSKKKNSLDAFKSLQTEGVLTSGDTNSKVGGRPPKPSAEKEKVRVAFSITENEEKALTGKTGGLSISVFIKKYLRDSTDIFN